METHYVSLFPLTILCSRQNEAWYICEFSYVLICSRIPFFSGTTYMTYIYMYLAELDTIKCRAEEMYARDPTRSWLAVFINLGFACAERRAGLESLSTYSDTWVLYASTLARCCGWRQWESTEKRVVSFSFKTGVTLGICTLFPTRSCR